MSPGRTLGFGIRSLRICEARTKEYQPSVVFVDADNKVVGTGNDPAEVVPGSDLVRGDLHSFAPSDLAARR